MNKTAIEMSPGAAKAEATPLRFVTAGSLFDGHDAAINIMRRIIQSQGAEVIHLGHNRSVEDVVRAALQEDADGIALSSYQGGHMEYFKYMVDMLKERGAGHIRVFGGGGGTITPDEGAELHAYGVERVYHPNDGMHMGLVPMIEDVVVRARKARESWEGTRNVQNLVGSVSIDDESSVGQMLSAIEDGALSESELKLLRKQWGNRENRGQSHFSKGGGTTATGRGSKSDSDPGFPAPVIGITGTGGAGKSSVVDELLLRFLHHFPEMRIAVLAVDPTRRKGGGALLGDRIRMNALRSHRVFMRSMATRRAHVATSAVLHDCIAFLKSLPFDLVIVETAGIGQADTEIVDLVDFPVYVMTSDYGAASQLEKIDMLDFAQLVVLNKYDRRGAEDALRDVRKQWKRNHTAFKTPDEDVPVYPTIASQFNDPGVTWMFANLCRLLKNRGQSRLSGEGASGNHIAGSKGDSDPGFPPHCDFNPQVDTSLKEPRATVLIPGKRVRYLAEIAEQGRATNTDTRRMAEAAAKAQHYYESLKELEDKKLPRELDAYQSSDMLSHIGTNAPVSDRSLLLLRQRYNEAIKELSAEAIQLLRDWPSRREAVQAEFNEYTVRGKAIKVNNYRETLS
ncbi:MAG TPA: cobalamin-dependent protein, partial [Rhodanobacteraceae bacterium]|nr:cobalamin-dependent protein [Rhodanobacteraceae bacterium]